DAIYIRRARAVRAARAQPAVVAGADHVWPQIREEVRATAARCRLHTDGRRAAPYVHRCADARHPDVHPVLEPVVVAEQSESLPAPLVAPRVLDPEPVLLVCDDRERVAARLVLAELDAAIRADIVPAAVHDRARVQDPDLRDRGVHCDQVAMIHAEIGTERTPA